LTLSNCPLVFINSLCRLSITLVLAAEPTNPVERRSAPPISFGVYGESGGRKGDRRWDVKASIGEVVEGGKLEGEEYGGSVGVG